VQTLSQGKSVTMAEQPKKPTGGAYGQFLSENRTALSQECAGKPITAVTKLAGERFKALGEAEKAQFQEKFQKAMEQYKKDMEAFLAAGGEKKAPKRKAKEEEENGKKRQKKDPDAPKKPVGGSFGCFLAANRATFQKACQGKPASEISKMAGEQWKKLSAEEKKPFDDEYETKKTAYAEAKKTYSLPEAETPSKKTSKGKESPKKDRKAPEKNTTRAAKGKGATSKCPEAGIELAETVAKAADKAGCKSQLIQLLSRQDILGSGKSQDEVLKALQDNNGLLHPAKRALLGA